MNSYLKDLIRKLKKIITLKEQENPYVLDYIDSLSIDIEGSMITYTPLNECNRYITVLNIVNYLSQNDVEFPKCKREVFKAIDEVKKILGGNYG